NVEVVDVVSDPAGNTTVKRTSQFDSLASDTLRSAGVDPVRRAVVSGDGKTIGYLVSTTLDQARFDDPSALDLVLSTTGQSETTRLPVERLLKQADKVVHLFFDRSTLVLEGSRDEMLVIATCATENGRPSGCRSVVTELDTKQYYLLGIGSAGFIFA